MKNPTETPTTPPPPNLNQKNSPRPVNLRNGNPPPKARCPSTKVTRTGATYCQVRDGSRLHVVPCRCRLVYLARRQLLTILSQVFSVRVATLCFFISHLNILYELWLLFFSSTHGTFVYVTLEMEKFVCCIKLIFVTRRKEIVYRITFFILSFKSSELDSLTNILCSFQIFRSSCETTLQNSKIFLSGSAWSFF